MKNYIPLHVHSHYSLLDGLSRPKQIADRCVEIESPSCAITDHGTISGCIEFYKQCKDKNIKPILGSELYICDADSTITDKSNSKLSHMLFLSKNYKGWKELIKIVSFSNQRERFYRKPRICLDDLQNFDCSNLVCISGHPGSVIFNDIVTDNKIDSEASKTAINKINLLMDIFGRDNFFLEIQCMDAKINPIQQDIANLYRDISKLNKIQTVATIDAHYCNKQDSLDQRILLCSNLKTTMSQVKKNISTKNNFSMDCFFKSDQYYIMDHKEISQFNTEEELSNTNVIDSMCEEYDILTKPQLPRFKCPDNMHEEQYLEKILSKAIIDGKLDKEYKKRTRMEFDVIKKAGLCGYFLIVKDIVNYVEKNNWLPGPGRGSAAGSLVSYLLNITSIDPIKYKLIFERFYNSGRNTAERVSMPDIDVDVPINKRDDVISYIKNRYGEAKVSQMITYNTMKGRGSLKEVLRADSQLSFDEVNKITKSIPDEARIADELHEMKESTGESSIIRWALENEGSKLDNWCKIDSDNRLSGPLSSSFEQAIRLEGTKCHQSKHAAGVAISAHNLSDICPMIYDTKTKSSIAGLEMNDLESLGVVKFDILGIALLDKIMCIRDMVGS